MSRYVAGISALLLLILSPWPHEIEAQSANKPENYIYDGTDYHRTPQQMAEDNRRIARRKAKEEKKLMRRNYKQKRNIEKLKKQGKFSGTVIPCTG